MTPSTLQAHVTSLETSQRLKEAGVEQGSEFAWAVGANPVTGKVFTVLFNTKNQLPPIGWLKIYSAFLASEIGEKLPIRLENNSHMQLEIWRGSKYFGWNIAYKAMYHRCGSKDELGNFHDDSLPEALGKMLLYLKEHQLGKED